MELGAKLQTLLSPTQDWCEQTSSKGGNARLLVATDQIGNWRLGEEALACEFESCRSRGGCSIGSRSSGEIVGWAP